MKFNVVISDWQTIRFAICIAAEKTFSLLLCNRAIALYNQPWANSNKTHPAKYFFLVWYTGGKENNLVTKKILQSKILCATALFTKHFPDFSTKSKGKDICEF